MKRIEAHLNPSRLEEVLDALMESGIGSMTITDALAWQVELERRRARSRTALLERLRPQTNLDIVLPDGLVPEVVSLISVVSGPKAEATILISPVEAVIDIRTADVSK
jgi:nitrogen regulatory protein PII